MRRSSSVARRLGAFGLGAVVVGGVLLGTGVAVSAQPGSRSAVVTPSKKTTTTSSSTTSSTVPVTAPPSTVPCSPAPTSAKGTNTTVTPNTTATLTINPANCIIPNEVVSMSGSGFVPSSPGTFLECNSDPNQPTVTVAANQIPISCNSPFATNGPGVKLPDASGNLGPFNFTVLEGAVGPPCAPSSCNTVNMAATDSTGGNPFTDATAYPCPPTTAQIAAGDTCGILYGDQGGDGVTVTLAFAQAATTSPVVANTPVVTTTTVAPASKPASSAKPKTTSTSTGSLAFTGTGPGLWWLAAVGAVLMVLGLLALAVVDEPRRMVRHALSRANRSEPPRPT